MPSVKSPPVTGPNRPFHKLALAAADVLTFDEFTDGVLEPLRVTLGGSGILLYRADRRSGLRALGGVLAESTPKYVSEELMTRDPIRRVLLGHYARSTPSTPLAWIARETAGMDWSAYRKTAAHDFYTRYDAHDIMLLAMTSPRAAPPMWTPTPDHGGLPAAILLARASGQRPFDRHTMQQIHWLLPHLRAAYRRIHRVASGARARLALEAAVERAAGQPAVLLDREGQVVWASRGGAWTFERSTMRELASFAKNLVGGTEDEASVVLSTGQGALPAKARVAAASTGEAFVLVSREVAERRDDWRPAIQTRFRLTPTETTVLSLVAEGLSNADIARRLCVSIETVRTHVRRVLSKLGVSSRSRAGAIARGG